MLYNDEDSTRDKFRHAVLDALDAEAAKIGHVHGWRDNELPALFRAIDKILDRLGVEEPA